LGLSVQFAKAVFEGRLENAKVLVAIILLIRNNPLYGFTDFIFYLKHKCSCYLLCAIKPVHEECVSAITLAQGREPAVKSSWLIIFNQVVDEWYKLFFNSAG